MLHTWVNYITRWRTYHEQQSPGWGSCVQLVVLDMQTYSMSGDFPLCCLIIATTTRGCVLNRNVNTGFVVVLRGSSFWWGHAYDPWLWGQSLAVWPLHKVALLSVSCLLRLCCSVVTVFLISAMTLVSWYHKQLWIEQQKQELSCTNAAQWLIKWHQGIKDLQFMRRVIFIGTNPVCSDLPHFFFQNTRTIRTFLFVVKRSKFPHPIWIMRWSFSVSDKSCCVYQNISQTNTAFSSSFHWFMYEMHSFPY